eukprot:SAG11_NODE_8360_length_1024_cov_4.880000_1_plen_85_part_00
MTLIGRANSCGASCGSVELRAAELGQAQRHMVGAGMSPQCDDRGVDESRAQGQGCWHERVLNPVASGGGRKMSGAVSEEMTRAC